MADAKVGQVAADAQPGGESRPPVALRAESRDNDRQLRRLAAFLEDAVGFQLALVTYDTRELRDQQIERLAEKLQGSEVRPTRLDLTETPQEKELLERLRGHLAGLKTPDGKRPAVMVVGLEATLDYRRLGPDAREGMAILENANAQRDAFARECPVAVAIWLNRTATSVLAARAPDLWHWRSGTFRFTAPPGWREQIEHRLLEMPGVQSLGLPRKDKLERITTLRDLLAESSAALAADTARGRQRRIALLGELAVAHLVMGDAQRAIPILEESLQIACEIGDRQAKGRSLGHLGIAHVHLGQTETAIKYHERALAIDREIGDRHGEGADLGNLGSAYVELGQMEKGIEYCERALAIDREIGDRHGEGTDLGNLGSAYAGLGQTEKAIEYYERALAIDREIGDRRGEGINLGNLAWAYSALGDIEKAIRLYDQGLAISREVGDRWGAAIVLLRLGSLYADSGDAKKATGLLEESLDIGEEIGDAAIIQGASRGLQRLRDGRQS